MSDTKVKIIETAVTAFSRHGLRRVSMSDVAEQAHISRQTLYAHYKNKDELFLAAMESAYASSLVDLKAAWGKAKKLSDVIDAYYEIAVFRPFEIMREHPDLKDLLRGASDQTAHMAKRVEAEKSALVGAQIAPYGAHLAALNSTPLAVGEYVVRTSSQLKFTTDDLDELKRYLNTLKSAVLAMTGQPAS